MLGRRLINTGAVACTTDTVQILDAGTTESLALYRFEDNADSDVTLGKFGGAAKFQSTNSYLTIPSWGQSQSSDADFSLSFWIKFESLPTTGAGFVDIINDSSGPAPMQLYIYGVSGGGHSISLQRFLGPYYYNSGYSSTAAKYNNFQTGQWYHIAISYVASGKNVSVYVNGTQSGSTYSLDTATTSYSAGSTNVYIKNQRGFLDQFRVFNKAISSSEVTTLYQETLSTVNTLQVLGDTSCIATYTFDGNSNDLSGSYSATSVTNVIYDYNGTASNITYATGKFDKAASFNGTDASIDIESQSLIQSIKSFSFWFKSKFIFGFYDPSSASSSDRRRWFINNTTNGSIKIQVNNDQYNYVQTGITEDSNWHHLAVIDNGEIYLDGNLLSNTFNTSYWITGGTNGTSRDTIRMGSGDYIGSANVSFVQGLMDQMRFFDKTLTAPEINSLYNETATSAASTTIDNPSTVAYYKMADGTDETGNYDATTVSNVDFNVQGKYGFAGNFNGSSSQIITGLTPQAGTTAATISLWINFNSYANSYAVIAGDNNSGATNQGFLMLATGAPSSYGSNGHLWVSLGDQSGGYDINTSVSFDSYGGIGSWIHVAVTVSGTSVSIYMNGTLATSYTSSVSYAPTASAYAYRFGYISGWGYLDAKLDQIRFFNKAISASEVSKLYNEIQCANTIDTPESYFNTVTYSNPSTSQAYAVGFAPDFVWFKERTGNSSHQLYDTIRTDHEALFTNTIDGEYDYSNHPNGDLAPTITSTGFTTPSVVNAGINTSNDSYVAWNWKAASSNTTNNDGSITSTVRASQESGFSIVKYAGNGTAGSTVGHGLGVVPSLIIWKNIDATSNWLVYSPLIGNDSQWLYLNLGNSAQSSGSTNEYPTNKVDPTSSVVTVNGSGSSNNINISGQNTIMYCFANVDGYQRIGSYVGNGSANGPFVFTGFEPAWLMIKRIDAAGEWNIFDNKRDTENPRDITLWAQANSSESTASQSGVYDVDFLTNGFQIKNTYNPFNNSSGTYLFWAIAANPDTTAPTKANSFKTVLYTGNSTSGTGITGVGFKPDLTWIKTRTNAFYHFWHDSVRLVQSDYYLASSDTLAQGTGAEANQRISSFDADGFTISGTGNLSNLNKSSNDYVSWNWKALDHDRNLAAINNDGSINSIVSANDAAGFSITKYVGNGSNGATVGHGLTVSPDLWIIKQLDGTQNWLVGSSFLSASDNYLMLDGSNAELTNAPNIWSINSSFIKFTTSYTGTNNNGSPYIMYSFKTIAGYSSIGTYSGTGSSGNTAITGLGFTPSFFIAKRIDVSGNSWTILDNTRVESNGNLGHLFADTNTAEGSTGYDVDFVSGGVTINTTTTNLNASGTNNYLYMAFK